MAALPDRLETGVLNGTAPWYARIGLYVLTHVAPYVVVFVVTLALVTGWLPFPVLTAFIALNAKIDAVEHELAMHEKDSARAAQILSDSLATWRAICWNTAKTDEGRDRCNR